MFQHRQHHYFQKPFIQMTGRYRENVQFFFVLLFFASERTKNPSIGEKYNICMQQPNPHVQILPTW